MLIVEGPDGAGKTTLVSSLCTHLELEVRPRSSTSDHGPVGDIGDWIDRDFTTNTHVGIYDRHPLISETIYGPLIRASQSDLLGMGPVEDLFEMLYSTSPLVIIYCLPPVAAVRVNVGQTHEGTTDHLRGVLKFTDQLYDLYSYRYLMDAARGVAIKWDYTDLDDGRNFEKLKTQVKGCAKKGRVW